MKVLLVNGSPHAEGCTHRALTEIAEILNRQGIETEIFWIGREPIGGCVASHACLKQPGCAFGGGVNEFREKAREVDGFVFGSPVHYAAAAGNLTAFLDRAFYSDMCSGGGAFRLKPAAVVVSARRAGTTAALDQLTKYLTIQEMPVVSSRYWNMVHGTRPEDVELDEEGLYTMRVLGHNMGYFLRCLEAGREAGVPHPETEPPKRTNFIRRPKSQ